MIWSRIKLLSKILEPLIVILGFLTVLVGIPIWGYVRMQMLIRGSDFWMWIFFLSFASLSSVVLLTVAWSPGFFGRLKLAWYSSKPKFVLKMLLSLIALSLPSLAVLVFSSLTDAPNIDARQLFRQWRELGPILVSTYASNGKVDYAFGLDGTDKFVEITLKTYQGNPEDSAGWVVFLVKGLNLGRYASVRFMIKGRIGGEKILFKAKDISGNELALPLDNYLNGGVTTNWQIVTIPFTHFGRVDFRRIDNISVAYTGNLRGTRPQTVGVSNFQFGNF